MRLRVLEDSGEKPSFTRYALLMCLLILFGGVLRSWITGDIPDGAALPNIGEGWAIIIGALIAAVTGQHAFKNGIVSNGVPTNYPDEEMP